MEENLDDAIQLLETSIDHSSINNDVLNWFQDLAQRMKNECEETNHEITNKANYVESLYNQVQNLLSDLHVEKKAFWLDMDAMLNKVEKENIKFEKTKSKLKLDIKGEVQQSCKKFK